MKNTAHVRINLAALRHNLTVVRHLCPQSRVMAMIKANAYGHGLLQVAHALRLADGFAVARLTEALCLRKSGIKHRILLLATLLDASDLAICAELQIDVTAHDASSVGLIAEQARHAPLRVWLKLDSGMHRVGMTPDAFQRADRLLSSHAGILELIHMTHFSDACNADVLERQMACFMQTRHRSSKSPASLANSAALIASRDTHADWVRPGIMLYGDNPFGIGHQPSLDPVMTLGAQIIAIREIGPGESVGYNACWTSRRISRIGTVGIGYGDGYPRHARNGTPISINGHRVPLVGRVSMDSLMVDLTDMEEVRVGDEAILWGPELPAAIIAASADTITYELFTSLKRRAARTHIDPGQ